MQSDAKLIGPDGTEANLLKPVPCRLHEAEIEYVSECWGCVDSMLLSGNGRGVRTYKDCYGHQPVQRNIFYSSNEFLSLVSKFMFGNYFNIGSEYFEVISNVDISQDSMIVWATDMVVDTKVVRLTLRLKDYSKTVSFYSGMPEFMAPAVLDSLARHIEEFANQHTMDDGTKK